MNIVSSHDALFYGGVTKGFTMYHHLPKTEKKKDKYNAHVTWNFFFEKGNFVQQRIKFDRRIDEVRATFLEVEYTTQSPTSYLMSSNP